MIIDGTQITGLSESAITEALSSETNILLGSIFLFVGIVMLYTAFNMYKKKKRSLKRMRKR